MDQATRNVTKRFPSFTVAKRSNVSDQAGPLNSLVFGGEAADCALNDRDVGANRNGVLCFYE